MTTTEGSQAVKRPRGPAKRQAILDAATTVFLRHGYVGSSMDEIAAVASASKQTLYKHFPDKEHLFIELVTAAVRGEGEARDDLQDLGDTEDVEADLTHFARWLLGGVMQPRVIQLRRLVIGEAGRFPQLGRTFWELGPGHMIDRLAEVLERLSERGVLAVDDPHEAAEQLTWLVLSTPVNRAMMLGDDEPPGDLDHYARTGVRAFLAAYRAR